MKRILMCLFVGILLISCNKNENISVPEANLKDLNSPYIRKAGDYIFWSLVKGANSYEVYLDGKKICDTPDLKYSFSDLTKDSKVYVVAKNSKQKSKASNELVVNQNTSFAEEEVLDLRGESKYSGSVENNIKKILLDGDISLNLTILDRSSDLFFDFNNCNIYGSIRIENASELLLSNEFSLVFNLNGNVIIQGFDGENGRDFSSSNYDNLEFDADRGEDGYDAIVAPTLALYGSGNLKVIGGNGGDGGIGSSTTTYEESATPGKGADGGEGGAGIITSLLVKTSNITFSYANGKGGQKGKPGNNGSIFTGPLVSLMWNDIYDIGKVGISGESKIGEEIVL